MVIFACYTSFKHFTEFLGNSQKSNKTEVHETVLFGHIVLLELFGLANFLPKHLTNARDPIAKY